MTYERNTNSGKYKNGGRRQTATPPMQTADARNRNLTSSIELDTKGDIKGTPISVSQCVKEALRRKEVDNFDTLARAQEEIERLQKDVAYLDEELKLSHQENNDLAAESADLRKKLNQANNKAWIVSHRLDALT